MKKVFVVTPNTNTYPWHFFGTSLEEVVAQFPGCYVEEDDQ